MPTDSFEADPWSRPRPETRLEEKLRDTKARSRNRILKRSFPTMSTSTTKQKGRTRRGKKKRAKKGSKAVATISAGGGAATVDVKEREDGRGWLYYAEYRHPEKGRQRPSLQTDDLEEAKRRALEIAEELVLLLEAGTGDELARISQRNVKLGQVFDEYRRARLPHFVREDGVPTGHWVNMDRVIRVAEAIWGRDHLVCEIGITQVDDFKVRRTRGGFEIEARGLPDQFDRLILPGKPTMLGPCGPRTVRGELSLLSIIFNWGTCHTVKGGRGRKLLAENPMDGIPFKVGTETPLQPVMSDTRHEVMLRYAPEVEAVTRGEVEYQRHRRDGRVELVRNPRGRRGRSYERMPRGFLTSLLMLARGSGRRKASLLGVRVGHVLLTKDQVRRQLLELGWPEDWANEWPYGGIYWDPKFDKEGYSRVTPMAKRLHDQLRAYIAGLGSIDPDALLFHAPSDPNKLVTSQQMWKWFRQIERVARAHGEDLPSLKGGAWHPHRRQWRSERAGYFDDKLVALVGGWKEFKNAHEAMQQGYLQYHPRALYLCAEFDPRRDAPPDGRIPGVKVVVNAPDKEEETGSTVTRGSHTTGAGTAATDPNRFSHKEIRRQA